MRILQQLLKLQYSLASLSIGIHKDKKKKTAQTEVTDNKDHRKFPVNLPHLYEYYTDISALSSKHVTQPQNFLS